MKQKWQKKWQKSGRHVTTRFDHVKKSQKSQKNRLFDMKKTEKTEKNDFRWWFEKIEFPRFFQKFPKIPKMNSFGPPKITHFLDPFFGVFAKSCFYAYWNFQGPKKSGSKNDILGTKRTTPYSREGGPKCQKWPLFGHFLATFWTPFDHFLLYTPTRTTLILTDLKQGDPKDDQHFGPLFWKP